MEPTLVGPSKRPLRHMHAHLRNYQLPHIETPEDATKEVFDAFLLLDDDAWVKFEANQEKILLCEDQSKYSSEYAPIKTEDHYRLLLIFQHAMWVNNTFERWRFYRETGRLAHPHDLPIGNQWPFKVIEEMLFDLSKKDKAASTKSK